MKNKLYIINYIIIAFIIYSCQGQKNKEEIYFESDKIQFNELEQVRDLILESFEKVDANFFSKKEQFIFKSYVNDFFQLAQDSCIPIYFDNIHQGWATLHFNITKLNFRFSIIRNSFGKFYYIGQTDKYLCYEFLKPYCKNYKDSMILNNFQLKPFSMTEISNEIKVLNELLKENIYRKNLFVLNNVEYNMLLQIFYEMYKSSSKYSDILQIPDFKWIEGENSRFTLEYIDRKKIYTGINFNFMGCFQFHKRNFGMFYWDFYYSEKKDTFYSVEKYFIPSRKIDKKYF